MNQHDCCDICADQCICGDDNCGEFWSPCKIRVSLPQLSMSSNQESHDTTVVRTVTAQDKQNLRKKLLEFMQEMRGQVQVNKMVTCPNILLEFNTFHINQVVECCQNLFTVENVSWNKTMPMRCILAYCTSTCTSIQDHVLLVFIYPEKHFPQVKPTKDTGLHLCIKCILPPRCGRECFVFN